MATDTRRSESYYETKGTVFGALIEAIDLAQLARLDAEAAREEIRDIVNEIIAIKNIVMSISEQEELLDDICNDVLGYGPLEPLLARDDIADIMVNGSGTVYIEVNGKIQKTGIRFRDNQQLLNICQRIVSQIGRRVDKSSPICDARLPDGSRVNVIAPPLALDGPALTIRKFKKDKLRLDNLVKFGSITPEGAEVLKILGRCRVNTIVSGGTGSGKTTLLNCLTQFIDDDERIITCEDAAELQLQQPHVVRLETRPPNLEGEGQVTMRDLVKNCLRMRPERIIVGEVRGPEAFDLLQAMNTGHDGSMGTLHANCPREALSRIESMITMGGYSLPSQDHPRNDRGLGRRRGAGGAPARRLAQDHPHHRGDRHGRRRHHHAGPVRLRDDRRGRPGQPDRPHKSTGIGRPKFWDRARYYGEEKRLAAALDAGEIAALQRRGEDLPAMKMQTLALFGMVATAIGGVAYVFIYPLLSGERKVEQRRASVDALRAGRARDQPARRRRSRREQVEETLKELDVKAKKPKSLPLQMKIAQAGLSWSKNQFLMISGGLGLFGFVAGVRHRRRACCRRSASASPRASACRDGCCRS